MRVKTVIAIAALQLLPTLWAQQTQAPASSPPARERFKNLTVLGDIPQSQWFATMGYIAGALGVKCEHCHVPGDFASDAKPEKQTARQMIKMMAAINHEFFRDERKVTCNSCHHGMTKPQQTPVPDQAFWTKTSTPTTVPVTSVEQIIARFRAATGQPPVSQSAEMNVHVLNGSGPPVDQKIIVYQHGPDKIRVDATDSNGLTITVINGTDAWIKTPREVRVATPQEKTNALTQAAHGGVPNIETRSDIAFAGTARVNDRDVNVVRNGAETASDLEVLYFDATRGLLLRRERYIQSAFGPIPTYTDYEGYERDGSWMVPREVNGKSVASKFERTISNRKFGQTLDSTLFNKPE